MCNHSIQSARAPLRKCWLLLTACAVATALSASAQSFVIGPNTDITPGAISYASSISGDPYAPSENAWFFGTLSLPITISYDAAAGVWQKQLSGAGQLDQYQEVNLLEYLRVGAARSGPIGTKRFSRRILSGVLTRMIRSIPSTAGRPRPRASVTTPTIRQ
jgi:hypothetical protein